MTLVLASTSAARRRMLTDAGIGHEAMSSGLDEEAAKAALAAERLSARDTADALAEMKAMRAAGRVPGAVVLAADSVVALDDGTLLDKPVDRANAARHLLRMAGTRHDLYSAAVIVDGGRPVWRHVGHARLWVRPFGADFVERYLDDEWPAVAGCVGCYRIEGPGIRLFDRVEGDPWTIQGMPLLEIARYLRQRGWLA